ncbi:phosphate ABC transporter substrate-binding protein [Shewanella gelidii]|uniref:Phosphate ABC transporter substrate-binding protein n=2 Tax=Shewanella gelidii TaxID=1642821 RepID=A0A917JGJ4_9GAMM|nr:phosphate ABC transporter substrate-binding protein [Shewanella gelidii]
MVTPLKFGAVPQQSASKLAKVWLPLIQQLSQDSGLPLQFATAPDIPTFEARLANGEYDIAYMNPYHYVTFHQSSEYLALAKEAHKSLQGIIVVKNSAPMQRIEQLQERSIAFPAPAAFAASMVPQASLKQLAVQHDSHYVGSHDSVYLAVAKGVMDAGGGVVRTFNKMDPAIKQQLRIIWHSPEYTPHAIATHSRISAQREKLMGALVKVSKNKKGKALLSNLGFAGFTLATDADWNPIRELKLHELFTVPADKASTTDLSTEAK